jgi:hypothetical protein
LIGFWDGGGEIMVRKIPSTQVAAVNDPDFRTRMMKLTIQQVMAHGELFVPLLNLISTFIDGLAAGASGQSKMAYLDYLQKNFPDLCAALGAEVFYQSFRNKAVHEFAIKPPYCLWREPAMEGKYVDTVEVDGTEWHPLNIDRLTCDFLNHIDQLRSSLGLPEV